MNVNKLKYSLAALGLCLLMGCGESSGTSSSDTGSQGNEQISPSNQSQSAEESPSSETVPEKTRLESILEIKKKNERVSQLYSYLIEEPNNQEVAVALVEQASGYPLSTVPEEFRKEQKAAFNDKIKEQQCKYASYAYYKTDDLIKTDKTLYLSIVCYDENEVIRYCPVLYGYFPSFDLNGTHSKEVVFHYDENGNWAGTDRLIYNASNAGWSAQDDALLSLSTEDWHPVSDTAVYDKNGRLIKTYCAGELCEEFQYNSEGCLTKSKWYVWNEVSEFKYDKNGYLTKEIVYRDGQKDYESDYDGYFEKVYMSFPGLFAQNTLYRVYNPDYVKFNEDGTKKEDNLSIIYNHVNPYEMLNKPVSISSKEYEYVREIRIDIVNQYGDGFMDVNSYSFYSFDESYEIDFYDYDYNLYYFPE